MFKKERGMVNLGLLVLRLVFGTLMMGHGSQKLFGWFKGPGVQGTASWMESMGMRPGKFWAVLAGGTEFGGGLLTALGFLNPLGPLATFAAMSMAAVKAHWGKPIWVSQGGAEYAITNAGISSALMATGPGEYSLDRLLRLRLPRWLVLPGLVGIGASIAYAMWGNRLPQAQAIQGWVQPRLQSAQQTVQQSARTAQQAMQHSVQSVRQSLPGRQAATTQSSQSTQPGGTPSPSEQVGAH
jgi:putative oxidoreductase